MVCTLHVNVYGSMVYTTNVCMVYSVLIWVCTLFRCMYMYIWYVHGMVYTI